MPRSLGTSSHYDEVCEALLSPPDLALSLCNQQQNNPMHNPQNALPIPSKLVPEAVNKKVSSAGSR